MAVRLWTRSRGRRARLRAGRSSVGRRQPEASGAQPAGGAFLGVSLDGMSASDGLPLGAVVPGSGAERAGLREGDVLAPSATPASTASTTSGASLRVRLRASDPRRHLRDGQDHAASVTLGTRP